VTEGEKLQFTSLPFFAPELFNTVEVANPMRAKQLRNGLTQLGEEGAIQVFRPCQSASLLLGAIGVLQLEVVTHRLKHEYGVEPHLAPANYRVARWVTAERPHELKRFLDANLHRVAFDVVDAPVVLAQSVSELNTVCQRWPSISFHALREHAGLVFQTRLEA